MSVASRLHLIGGVLLIVGILLGGCERSGEEDEAVAGTIFSYIDAVVRGEGRVACRLLTGEQERAVLEGARAKFPELGARSCADALSKVGKILTPDVKRSLPSAIVTNVRAEGGIATAELVGGTTVIRLARSGDRWLIASGLNLWTASRGPTSESQRPPVRWRGEVIPG